MKYQTTFYLLYRSWKGQQVVRWGRKGHDWIISFPAKERGRAFLEIHCDVSPLVETVVSAIVEYTDGSLFEFEGDIPADHPVNPLKRIPVTQKRLDLGKVAVDYKKKDEATGFPSWQLQLSGRLLFGIFSLTSTDGVMYSLAREEKVKEADEPPPLYIPLKASVRFEVDAEKDYDLSEAWAWIKEQDVDVLAQPKLNGFRVILDTARDILYFEGDEANHADRYPDIMRAGKKLGAFVFDGELIADEKLYLFSMLFRDGVDLRNQEEEKRYKLVEKLHLVPPLFLMPSQVVKSEADLAGLLSSSLQLPLSEGLMLKRTDTTNLQKWTVQWAKVKLVIYRVGKILDVIPVENRETFVYELGFKDAFGNIVSLGTSMTTSILLEIGDRAVVSLPASATWTTPVIREKTDKPVDIFIPVERIIETVTTPWVELMRMEAEITTAGCPRLSAIMARCMDIYNYDWQYQSERSYALSVYQEASEANVKCHASITVPASLDFGSRTLDGISTEYLEISNDGRSDGDELYVSLSIVSGGTYYSLSGITSAWIQGGESASFPIAGDATDVGTLKGEVSVSNSLGEPKTVSLVMNVRAGGILDYPGTIDFGEVKVDITKYFEVTLQNIGGVDLRLFNFQQDIGPFWLEGDPEGLYTPGQTRRFSVWFRPFRAGPSEGSLRFETDERPASGFIILKGVGTD